MEIQEFTKQNKYNHITGDGRKPISFFPVVEDFIGEGGSYTNPRAIQEKKDGVKAGQYFEGKEALGGIRFETITLQPGEGAEYIVIIGASELGTNDGMLALEEIMTEEDEAIEQAMKNRSEEESTTEEKMKE